MDSSLKKIIQAAENGGRILKKYFGKTMELQEKSTVSDFRTEADLESEAVILKILSLEFPHYNIFSEEKGIIDKKSDYTFVVDPMDGSNNFVLGIPNFSVCIALLKNNEVISAVIHSPILNQTYRAEKGKGAFLENKKLRVNQEADIKRVSVVYTCNDVNSREYADNLTRKLNAVKVKRVLTNWSPALDFCLLASGKIEAIINNDNEIYDYIAGKLIAQEAGALITDFKGRQEKNDKNSIFLASNGTKIHEQLLKIL
ncbi:MAG: inositol monophosphatase [Patescibacteria group bacterium]|nr:inositol monophosphatase [Patescibacteria group bacterium]